MKIIRELGTPVKQADQLPQRDNLPWCEEHEEYFEVCICPKAHSTPDGDGWQIEGSPSGQIAYPTEELYHELSLWIQRKESDLVCLICDGKVAFPEGHAATDSEAQDLVEAFFEIHSSCGRENEEQN